MGPIVGDAANFSVPLPQWVQNNIPGAQWAAQLGDKTRIFRDYLTGVGTTLRKFEADGSIRGLNPEVMAKIFPTIKTRPAEAIGQVQQLLDTVEAERNSFLKTQSDKVMPPELQPRTPTPTPQAAPPPTQGKPSPGGSPKIPAEAAAALKDKGWGKLTLPDGRVYYKHKDGSITSGQ
jgi:hypothetical protein